MFFNKLQTYIRPGGLPEELQVNPEPFFLTEAEYTEKVKQECLASVRKTLALNDAQFACVTAATAMFTERVQWNAYRHLADMLKMKGEAALIHAFASKDIIARAAFFYQKRLRTAVAWTPNGVNEHLKAMSLVRHLFANYPMPYWLEYVWVNDTDRVRDWYLPVAKTGSVYDIVNFPWPITRRIAGHLMNVSQAMSFTWAYRYAQFRQYGAKDELIDVAMETFLADDFSNFEFWDQVIEFLVRESAHTAADIPLVLVYIRFQKFGIPLHNREGEVHTAPQPGFEIANRKLAALNRQAASWYKFNRFKFSEWNLSGFQPYRKPVTDSEKENHFVEIVELVNQWELRDEGIAMHHCVADYGDNCQSGTSSIWSLRMTNEDSFVRLATIEVGLEDRALVQVQLKHDNEPGEDELQYVRLWAEANSIGLGNYTVPEPAPAEEPAPGAPAQAPQEIAVVNPEPAPLEPRPAPRHAGAVAAQPPQDVPAFVYAVAAIFALKAAIYLFKLMF